MNEKKSQSFLCHQNSLSQTPKQTFQEEIDKINWHNINTPNFNFILNKQIQQSNSAIFPPKGAQYLEGFHQQGTMKSPQMLANTFFINNPAKISIQNTFYNELQPTNNQKMNQNLPLSNQQTPSRPSSRENTSAHQIYKRIKNVQLNQNKRSKSSLSKTQSNNVKNIGGIINQQEIELNNDSFKQQLLQQNVKSPIASSYRSVSIDYSTGIRFQNRQKVFNENPKRQYQTIDQGIISQKSNKQEHLQKSNQFRSINAQDQSSISRDNNESFFQYENYLNDSFFIKNKQQLSSIQSNPSNSYLPQPPQSLLQTRHPSSQNQYRSNSIAKRKQSSKSVTSNHNELAKVYGGQSKVVTINKNQMLNKQTIPHQQQLQPQQETIKARPPSSSSQNRRSPLLRQRKFKQHNNSVLCESPEYQPQTIIQFEQIPKHLHKQTKLQIQNDKNLIFSFNSDFNPNRSFQDIGKASSKSNQSMRQVNRNIQLKPNSKFQFNSLDNIDENDEQLAQRELYFKSKNNNSGSGVNFLNISSNNQTNQAYNTIDNCTNINRKSFNQNNGNLSNKNMTKQINLLNSTFDKQSTKKIYEMLKTRDSKSNNNSTINGSQGETKSESSSQDIDSNNQKKNIQQNAPTDTLSQQRQNENSVKSNDRVVQVPPQSQYHFKRKYNAQKPINQDDLKVKILSKTKQLDDNLKAEQQVRQISKSYLHQDNSSNSSFHQQIYSILPKPNQNKKLKYDLIGAEPSVQDKQSISPNNSQSKINSQRHSVKNIQNSSHLYFNESQRNLVEDSIEKFDVNNDRNKQSRIQDQINVYYDKYLSDSNGKSFKKVNQIFNKSFLIGIQQILKGRNCEDDQEQQLTRFSLAKVPIIMVGPSKESQQNSTQPSQRSGKKLQQKNSLSVIENNSAIQQRHNSVFQNSSSNRDIAIEFGFSKFHSIENSQIHSDNNSRNNSPIPTPIDIFQRRDLGIHQMRGIAQIDKNMMQNYQNNQSMQNNPYMFNNSSLNNLENDLINGGNQQQRVSLQVEDFESSLEHDSISLGRKDQLQKRKARESLNSVENQSDVQSQYTAIFQKVDNLSNKHNNQSNKKKYNFYSENSDNPIQSYLEEPLETFGDIKSTPQQKNN